MYTRCPQCQTTFRLTAVQLKARAGQVRCGRCQNVFQAEQYLVERLPKAAKAAPRKRVARKPVAIPPATAGTEPPAASSSPPPRTVSSAYEPEPALPARSPGRATYWIAGSVAAMLVLLAQAVVFYGQPLGHRVTILKPAIAGVCELLPCRQLAPIDLQRLDLTETRVAPHPRYDRALRVKATIINRADHAQPYPLLEVSLIDNQGHLVARRAYPPREYLTKSEAIAEGLPPNVAVHVSLDITSPGTKASGYEVLLLPPSE